MGTDTGAWPFRAVADTNVYVSAVHPADAIRVVAAGFQQSPSEEFIVRAVGHEFVLLWSLSAYLELAEKLEELGVPLDLAQELLESLRAIAEDVAVVTSDPFCHDEDDDKFVWIALDGLASHLVTADRQLTTASRDLPFKTMRVVGFLRELRATAKLRGRTTPVT